jgi:23S rRNA (adenine2030-N6)-methyltransferase
MLSYRHGFHAGNWADVQKHSVLALLLGHLRRKNRPFCVLDAFAGDGVYDLAAPEALKTGEFQEGIARLWQRRDAPAGADWYLDQVRALNPDNLLARYPGSPALARAVLRETDRLILGELHPAAHQTLKLWAARDRRIALHRRDGVEFLDALIPPPIKRGMVLVDPAYEVKDEYETLPRALTRAMNKWQDGIYAVWYPVLPAGRHATMIEALARLPAKAGILCAELSPPHPPAAGMQGAGMIIANPPWRFFEDMTTAGDWIAHALWGDPPGRHYVQWLAEPRA